MLSPLPRKGMGPSSSPWSSEEAFDADDFDMDPQEVCGCAPVLFDIDEATHDLREVMSYKTVEAATKPALENRCLSVASTRATTPPASLSSITPPLSPEFACVVPTDADTLVHSQQRNQSGIYDKSTAWAQARKVFVGGIPQNINQVALFNMFSQFGKVKQAWLQALHYDTQKGSGRGTKIHRGFGFVIFCEKHSVDQLLGDAFSKFIYFGDTMKFEVKRAVGKTMPGMSGQEGDRRFSRELPSKMSPLDCPRAWKQDSWQASVPHFDSYSNAPCMASYQALEADGQWQATSNPPLTVPWSQSTPSQSTGAPSGCFQTTESILDELVGQQPRDRHALTQLLLQAMPDRYDD